MNLKQGEVFQSILTEDPHHAVGLWDTSECKLNKSQQHAVKSALTHRFKLIQGPPG